MELPQDTNLTAGARELKIADQLIQSMTSRFDPASYHDEYAEKVRRMVAAKAKGQKITAPAAVVLAGGATTRRFDTGWSVRGPLIAALAGA